METVLVTGIYGFTGQYVQSELLAQGYNVVGLSSDLTIPDDVANEIAQIQPDSVIHLAGVAFVGHGNANAFYEVNLIGTRNLLEALAKHAPNVRSILLTSSGNIYGNYSEGIINENILPEPSNEYAVSKLGMEKMAMLWTDRLPIFIVRPFNYTGVGQNENFLIPKIVAHFKDKKSVIELGNLDIWREFGDVRNVANVYRKLLALCPTGKTLNVCTGQTYSLREVITICEKITGHNIEIEVNPLFVRANEVRELTGDNSYLKEHIGEQKTPLLEDTLAWMLEK
ncbi:MAG: GDP-mannose 4,6-dehydratase [Gammaproteobacteria bacterium]|nr:GDP-mannose 4,6-dehydratase [Gammaproteobacteria bacterium]